MNIDQLLDMWSEDCKLNETELATESTNVPLLHAKYLKLWSGARLKLKALNTQRKSLKIKLTDYYRGDLNNPEDLKEIGRDPWEKKVLRQDVPDYVSADYEMQKIEAKIAYQEEKVEALTEILKNIANRGFAIKNAVDFLKFMHGN